MFDGELAGIGTSYLMADISKPVTFRMLLCCAVLLTLELPAFMMYTWPAMVKWCWLGLAVEVLSALMVQVFFPDAAEMMAAYHRGCRDGFTGKLATPNVVVRVMFGVFYCVTFTIFPLQEVMNIAAPHIRIKQVKSPVGPILRTLLLSFFCLLKTWETQFFFNLQLLSANGVGYLDAIALSYTVRHMECNECLLAHSFMHAEHSSIAGAQVATEAFYQLVGYLA